MKDLCILSRKIYPYNLQQIWPPPSDSASLWESTPTLGITLSLNSTHQDNLRFPKGPPLGLRLFSVLTFFSFLSLDLLSSEPPTLPRPPTSQPPPSVSTSFPSASSSFPEPPLSLLVLRSASPPSLSPTPQPLPASALSPLSRIRPGPAPAARTVLTVVVVTDFPPGALSLRHLARLPSLPSVGLSALPPAAPHSVRPKGEGAGLRPAPPVPSRAHL